MEKIRVIRAHLLPSVEFAMDHPSLCLEQALSRSGQLGEMPSPALKNQEPQFPFEFLRNLSFQKRRIP